MIRQGTTPEIKLKCLNFNPENMNQIEVSIRNNYIVIKKLKDVMTVTSEFISFYLTQEETFNLMHESDAEIQIRVDTGVKLKGDINEIKESGIIKVDVGEFIGKRDIL